MVKNTWRLDGFSGTSFSDQYSDTIRDHYDFSKMKRRKNSYIKYLKQPVNIGLGRDNVSYFKLMAEETDISYQPLITLYLRDCAIHNRKLHMKWNPERVEEAA